MLVFGWYHVYHVQILVYCVSMLTFDNWRKTHRMGIKNQFQIVQSIGKWVTMFFLMSFINAGKTSNSYMYTAKNLRQGVTAGNKKVMAGRNGTKLFFGNYKHQIISLVFCFFLLANQDSTT